MHTKLLESQFEFDISSNLPDKAIFISRECSIKPNMKECEALDADDFLQNATAFIEDLLLCMAMNGRYTILHDNHMYDTVQLYKFFSELITCEYFSEKLRLLFLTTANFIDEGIIVPMSKSYFHLPITGLYWGTIDEQGCTFTQFAHYNGNSQNFVCVNPEAAEAFSKFKNHMQQYENLSLDAWIGTWMVSANKLLFSVGTPGNSPRSSIQMYPETKVFPVPAAPTPNFTG